MNSIPFEFSLVVMDFVTQLRVAVFDAQHDKIDGLQLGILLLMIIVALA